MRKISSYNQKMRSRRKVPKIADENGHVHEHDDGTMPYIVVVIDENVGFDDGGQTRR